MDPVLPLDPYFSSNSANSFLFRETKRETLFGRVFHSWTGWKDVLKSSFIDQDSVSIRTSLTWYLPIKSVEKMNNSHFGLQDKRKS